MDPFLYSLIALIALALGLSIGYLIARGSSSGTAIPLGQWPHVVVDKTAPHPTAVLMLEAIIEEVRDNGPPDDVLRFKIATDAAWCQYGHFMDPMHRDPEWDHPTEGAKGKVLRAYNYAFGRGVPQDWQLCADELDHNP
jgi:hypothetical protein